MDNKSDKVTLWTRQHIDSLKELEAEGAIRTKREHLQEKFEEITDYIVYLYKWFVNAAEKMVPKSADIEFPVWCSISEENMLRPTEDQVVYVLEVDKSDIISFINEKTAHFYPEERKKVMDSWYRVFETDQWDIFRIQANIWEIRPEMIKEILYYNQEQRK